LSGGRDRASSVVPSVGNAPDASGASANEIRRAARLPLLVVTGSAQFDVSVCGHLALVAGLPLRDY